jgi:hypothetical protein
MPAEFISPTERHTIAKVFTFAEILRAADLMPHDEDEYFERPWKWGREHQAWVAAGRPRPPEDDSTVGVWEEFVVAAEAAVAR